MPCRFKPSEACINVPAKYTPGRLALSQYGVCAGRRLWPKTETPSWGRSRSGATKPVAAMTSSTSKTSVLPSVGLLVCTRYV